MNGKGIALLSAAALLAAGSASAGETGGGSDISWTYAQIGYVENDGSDFFESDGFDIMGSIALAPNWHASASYTALSGDSDYYSEDIDNDTWEIAVGYNAGLGQNSQAFVDLGYFDSDLDVDGLDGGEGDASGIKVTGGVRFKPASTVELGAAVTYTRGTIDNFGLTGGDLDYTDTSISLSGQYFFVPEFSVGARANFNGGGSSSEISSSSDQFSLFLRYSFGGSASDISDSSDASY